MSDTLIIANSIWPNGMKVDSDGYAVFYPLGTNKVKVPTSYAQWPKGNKLVSPYVFQDDKLVGFVDTKALTVSKKTAIYLPYEHIEAEFSAINKGKLQIHAPNATTKKASWKDSGVEDIPEAQFKYKGCKTVGEIESVDNYYLTADLTNETWSEPLWDLTNGYRMFDSCHNLTTFSSDLLSLTDGTEMFFYCSKLASFSSDLSSLQNGYMMFADGRNLISFSSDLPSLTDGSNMFLGCTKLTTFSSDLPSLTEGENMFNTCNKLTSFSSDLSSLTNGRRMFYYCTNLTTFSSDLPSLTNGTEMFYYCTKLASFSSDLYSLQNGWGMFQSCDNLTTFTSELPNLTEGKYMFQGCTKLTSFNSDLSNLTNTDRMFQGCDNLTSFNGDLSSLTYAYDMFYNCTNLTSFKSDLSSLTNGWGMFQYCKLDTDSVKNIAETINTVTNNPSIHIYIGNSNPSEEEHTYLTQIHNKGWQVYVNGSSNSDIYTPAIASLDETGETQSSPKPYWAKPVPSDEEHAQYVDVEGNFFNILGGQFIYVNDPDTYGMFTCEEDAAANMRLTPYVKPQTEIENQ